MTFGTALKISTILLAAGTLSACITVEPTSASGKAAVKTASVIKKIRPVSKPTMNIPAGYKTGGSEYEAACASALPGELKRVRIVDSETVSEIMVKCKAPKVVKPAPRTIRLSVDGGPDQVFEIDANGKAIPAGTRPATTPAAVSMPATQIIEAAPKTVYVEPQTTTYTQSTYQAPVYQPPAQTRYRVRRGDNLYSIARRNCVSLDALVDANGISRPYTINPDQLLILPGGGC